MSWRGTAFCSRLTDGTIGDGIFDVHQFEGYTFAELTAIAAAARPRIDQ
jgi:hypothetical protein